MNDVYLLNSPFTFQSMEKHAAYCAMIRLGLKVPPTVLVPHKDPPDNSRFQYTAARYNLPFDLRRDRRADRLPAVHEALRRRPVDRGQPRPQPRRARARLRRLGPAADAPAGVGRGLRRVRALAVDRPRDDGHEVPPRAADARPLRGRARLPVARARRGGADDQPARQRVLPLGVQLVRVPGPRRPGPPDRLRQRLARRRADQPALLLPVGDQDAAEVVHVLPGHRPAPARSTSTPAATSRSATARTSSYEEKLAAYRRAGRRVLRGRPLPRLLRQPPRPRRRARARLGRARPTSTGLLVDTVRATYPAHEHERFVAHLRGLSASGCASRAAASRPGPERGRDASRRRPARRAARAAGASAGTGRAAPAAGAWRAAPARSRSSCSKAIGRQRSSTTRGGSSSGDRSRVQVQVLGPQAQPGVAGQLGVVGDDVHLGVVEQRVGVQVGRADRQPAIVDDPDLGVHVQAVVAVAGERADRGGEQSPGARRRRRRAPPSCPHRVVVSVVGLRREHDRRCRNSSQGGRRSLSASRSDDLGRPQELVLEVDEPLAPPIART